MRRRQAVVATLLGALLLTASPAMAKGEFEFVISGGELRHPVTVDSVDIYAAVRGVIWSPETNAPALLGPVYVLDMYTLGGGHRTHETRWWYYPRQGGALVRDPSPSPGQLPVQWERFSPAFQRILNDAIKSHPANRVLILALAGMLLVCAFFFARRELRSMVESRSMSPTT